MLICKEKNSTLWSKLKVKIFSNPYQSEENNKEKEKGKSSFLKGTLENILIAPKKGSTQYTQCIQYALKGKLKQKKKQKNKKNALSLHEKWKPYLTQNKELKTALLQFVIVLFFYWFLTPIRSKL